MNSNVMCDYCGKWFEKSEMTPLYEKNKPHVNYYCTTCIDTVRRNVNALPFRQLFTFGKKGE